MFEWKGPFLCVGLDFFVSLPFSVSPELSGYCAGSVAALEVSCRQGVGGEGQAEMAPVNQPEVEVELQECGAAERRWGQDDGGQEHRDYSGTRMARSVRDGTLVRPRARGNNRRHGSGKSAGVAATTTATNDLRVDGANEEGCPSVRGKSAQHVGGEAGRGREEQEDEGPTTRAAARTREVEGRRGRGQTDDRGKVAGERGTKGRPTGLRQPQGAVSVPSHTPQPHQAQPRGERRSTGSRTGACTCEAARRNWIISGRVARIRMQASRPEG